MDVPREGPNTCQSVGELGCVIWAEGEEKDAESRVENEPRSRIGGDFVSPNRKAKCPAAALVTSSHHDDPSSRPLAGYFAPRDTSVGFGPIRPAPTLPAG